MVDVRAVGKDLARLAWVATRSFVGTLGTLTLAGIVLAAASYFFLRQEPLYAVVAALVAMAEAVSAGIFLGGKRALVMAVVEGVRKCGLGRKVVGLVFQHVLGGVEGQHGERGGVVAQSLERLPLRQAETALRSAISTLIAAPGEGGWLRRKIRDRLLRVVEAGALTRFREEEARHGGVDLHRVRAELEGKAEDALVEKVSGGMKVWTIAVIVLLPLTVAAQTYIVLAWLRSHG